MLRRRSLQDRPLLVTPALDLLYPTRYRLPMNTFYQTDQFSNWLQKLRDIQAKARIVARIKSAEVGNLGDCVPVGEGVSEMRLHFGPGYRLYFWKKETRVYWLLIGGNKSSQQKDIRRAQALRREIEEIEHGERE